MDKSNFATKYIQRKKEKETKNKTMIFDLKRLEIRQYYTTKKVMCLHFIKGLVLYFTFAFSLNIYAASEYITNETSEEKDQRNFDQINATELLPGVEYLNPELLEELEREKEKKGSTYYPYTRHLNPDGQALFTNRLLLEKSPYLLQHAHNPINWYPWSEEAFEEAKKRNWPILLSIGYSTCHWCHRMAEESFEDLEIAEYINKNYIVIKLDREERPDLDNFYFNAVRVIARRGGWPMTIWLTPDKHIFYGGTYFPPRETSRSPGLLALLKEYKEAYQENPDDIAFISLEEIKQGIQERLSPDSSSDNIPGTDVFETLYTYVKENHDPMYGGFKKTSLFFSNNKFPFSFPYRFLTRSYLKTQDEEILQTVHISLNGMLKGGIHDHIGGGFHRYSTDNKWLIPHFEKMLYDQASLALSYLEAYHLLGQESYKDTAKGILDYVIRDIQSEEAGFYSATDARSLVVHPVSLENKEDLPTGKKEEGFYFTWTSEEIDSVLNEKQAELIKNYYGVTSSGNFKGRNILYVSKDLPEVAEELHLDPSEANQLLASAREALYQARQSRPLPSRDEKILSGWNALMISALVHGYFILNEKTYLLQAERSAQFILDNMYKEGQLYRSWKEGIAYIPAFLQDYAFFISALLDLFEWTGNINWLNSAIELDQILEQNFEDKEEGGFFMTGHDYETLSVREKSFSSKRKLKPSGNSVMLMNLLRLNELTGNDHYRTRAENSFRVFGADLERRPALFPEALLALDYYHSSVSEIVIVLPDEVELESDSFFNELKKWYLPNKVLTVVHHSQVEKRQELLQPIQGKIAIDGQTTVYICEKGICQLPAFDLEELRRQLKEIQSFGWRL